MSNSKFDLIQSISEQQQKTEQLQTSLQQLSETLNDFEMSIKQNEQAITHSISALKTKTHTIESLRTHIQAILSEIGNLSPQSIKTLTTSYSEQIDALTAQLSSIDISTIKSVQTSIESFSVSMQTLQKEINSQLQSIEIDKQSLQQSIQAQVQQAIANQSGQIDTLIESVIKKERMKNIKIGVFIALISLILIAIYMSFQIGKNATTISTQNEMIKNNAITLKQQADQTHFNSQRSQ